MKRSTEDGHHSGYSQPSHKLQDPGCWTFPTSDLLLTRLPSIRMLWRTQLQKMVIVRDASVVCINMGGGWSKSTPTNTSERVHRQPGGACLWSWACELKARLTAGIWNEGREGGRKKRGKKGRRKEKLIQGTLSVCPLSPQRKSMSSHSPTSLGPVLATSLALNRLPSSQPFIQVGKYKLLSLSTMQSSRS